MSALPRIANQLAAKQASNKVLLDESDNPDVDWNEPAYANQAHVLVRDDTSNIDSSDPYDDGGNPYTIDVDVFYADDHEIMAASPGEHIPHTYEQANPGEVYTRTSEGRKLLDTKWQMYQLPLASLAQPRQVLMRDPRRKRALIWTDAANTNAVGVSHEATGSNVAGGSGAMLGPASVPLEIYGNGDVYVFNPGPAAAVLVYVMQETETG